MANADKTEKAKGGGQMLTLAEHGVGVQGGWAASRPSTLPFLDDTICVCYC